MIFCLYVVVHGNVSLCVRVCVWCGVGLKAATSKLNERDRICLWRGTLKNIIESRAKTRKWHHLYSFCECILLVSAARLGWHRSKWGEWMAEQMSKSYKEGAYDLRMKIKFGWKETKKIKQRIKSCPEMLEFFSLNENIRFYRIDSLNELFIQIKKQP